MTRPLCSVEFPRLLSYYGSLRPCASHRYSHPRGASPWISPLPSRRQVPTFHTRAWSRVTPPLCRVPPTQATGFSWTRPGPTTPPGFDTVHGFSTRFRWFIRFVSTGPHLMRSSRTFFRDAHHQGSLPQQLTVFWSLPLPAGSEGPTLIPHAARHKVRQPSWLLPYAVVAHRHRSQLVPSQDGTRCYAQGGSRCCARQRLGAGGSSGPIIGA